MAPLSSLYCFYSFRNSIFDYSPLTLLFLFFRKQYIWLLSAYFTVSILSETVYLTTLRLFYCFYSFENSIFDYSPLILLFLFFRKQYIWLLSAYFTVSMLLAPVTLVKFQLPIRSCKCVLHFTAGSKQYFIQ